MRWRVALVALAMLAMPAAAQVHKCAGPDGPVYQQQPCEGEGQAIRGISVTPGASPEQQQAMERERAKRQQAASDKRQQRIEETGEAVRKIQRENADPEKCQRARNAIARIEALAGEGVTRGEMRYRTFEYRNRISLYCNP